MKERLTLLAGQFIRLTMVTAVVISAECAFGREQTHPAPAPDPMQFERLSYAQVSRQVKVLEAKLTVLTRWVDAQPPELEEVRWGINPELAELRAKRDRIEQQLKAGLTTGGQMTEEHPRVIGWRQELVELDQRMANLPQQVVVNRVQRTNEQRLIGEREILMMSCEIRVLNEERRRLASAIKTLNRAEPQAANRPPVDGVEHEANNNPSTTKGAAGQEQMGQE